MSGAKYSSEVEGRLKKDGFIDAIREVWVDNAALLNQAAASMGITAVDGIKERIDGLDWTNFIGAWENLSATGAGAGMNTAMSGFMSKFANELGGGDLYKYGKGGETFADTLVRMASDLNAFNQMIAPLGKTLEGKDNAIMVQKIINTVGDLDKVKTGVNDFLDAVYTDAERKTHEANVAQQRLSDQAKEIQSKTWGKDFIMPDTREGFRTLVTGLLEDPSIKNMSIFSSLMQVSEEFKTVADAADEATEKLKEQNRALQDLDVRMLNARGDSDAATNLERQLSAQREMEQAISDGMSQVYLDKLAEVLRAEEDAANTLVKNIWQIKTAFVDLTTGILEAMKQIMTGPLAQLSPKDAYDVALKEFNSATVETIAGASQTFLTASQAYYASGAQYQADRAFALQKMAGMAGVDPTLDSVNEGLLNMKNMSEILNSANKTLADTLIAGLPPAFAISLAAYTVSEQTRLSNLATLTTTSTVLSTATPAASPMVRGFASEADYNAYMSSLPGYAVGSPYIPSDMTANIHQGEMIIDRSSSDILRNYGIQVSGSADNRGVEDRLDRVIDNLESMDNRLESLETKARLVANA